MQAPHAYICDEHKSLIIHQKSARSKDCGGFASAFKAEAPTTTTTTTSTTSADDDDELDEDEEDDAETVTSTEKALTPHIESEAESDEIEPTPSPTALSAPPTNDVVRDADVALSSSSFIEPISPASPPMASIAKAPPPLPDPAAAAATAKQQVEQPKATRRGRLSAAEKQQRLDDKKQVKRARKLQRKLEKKEKLKQLRQALREQQKEKQRLLELRKKASLLSARADSVPVPPPPKVKTTPKARKRARAQERKAANVVYKEPDGRTSSDYLVSGRLQYCFIIHY